MNLPLNIEVELEKVSGTDVKLLIVELNNPKAISSDYGVYFYLETDGSRNFSGPKALIPHMGGQLHIGYFKPTYEPLVFTVLVNQRVYLKLFRIYEGDVIKEGTEVIFGKLS